MKYKIKAQNIKCDGCVSKIKESIGKIESVQQVDVNIEEATITIKVNANSSKRMFTDRLKEIGYPQHNSVFSGLKKMFSN